MAEHYDPAGAPGHHVTWRIARLILILAALRAQSAAASVAAAARRIPPEWRRRGLWAGLFAAWPLTEYLRHAGVLPGGIVAATAEAWAAGAPAAWGLLAIRRRQQAEWVSSRGRLAGKTACENPGAA